jgi:magnesium transporter
VWLVVLFGGQLLTAHILESYSSALQQWVSLTIFIPLIIATGGNSGSQSSSLIIRALAVGEVASRDWMKVLLREVGFGIVLGAMLGILGFARALFAPDRDDSLRIAFTVAGSILAVAVLGNLLGSLLPLAIKRVGIDPAVSSTPLIASVADVLGLAVYLTLAQIILGIAL